MNKAAVILLLEALTMWAIVGSQNAMCSLCEDSTMVPSETVHLPSDMSCDFYQTNNVASLSGGDCQAAQGVFLVKGCV